MSKWVVDDIDYGSKKKLAKAFGLTPQGIDYRLSRGLTLKEAVSMETLRGVVVAGVHYPSVEIALQEFNNTKYYYQVNREKGMSVEEAIVTVPKKKTYILDKGVFHSLADVARAYNITPSALGARIRDGIPIEQAVLGRPVRENKGSGREIVIEGVTYPSIKKAAEELNLKLSVLSDRLRKGWSIEDAVDAAQNVKENEPVFFRGREYESIASLAKEYNIGYSAFLSRLRKGMSLEQAVTMGAGRKGRQNMREIVVMGVSYMSISDACKAYNISQSVVTDRMRDGWSIDDAFTTPVKHNVIKSVVIGGVEFPNKQAAYDYYGINKCVVERRVQSGMSLEEAVITPYSKARDNKKQITFRGVTYPSINEACAALGYTVGRVSNRIREYGSFEAAIESIEKDTIYVHGEQFFSVKSVCDKFNMPRSHMEVVMANNTGTLSECCEKAVDIFLGNYEVSFLNRVNIPLIKAVKETGLNLSKVQSELRRGTDFNSLVHRIYWVYNDRVYKTKTDIAEALGTSRSRFVNFIKKNANLSHDEIISLYPLEYRQLGTEWRSLKVRKINPLLEDIHKEFGEYITCRCSVCGRRLFMHWERALTYTHQEETCWEYEKCW